MTALPPEGGPRRRETVAAAAVRRFLFAAGSVLLTLVLALALVEVALRVYSRVTPNVDVEFFRYANLMKGTAPGSELGFLHRPDSRLTLFGVDVTINSRGYRDEEIEPEPEAGETRVALIGDSVTFGWGVPYGERFSEILEREWTKRTGTPFRVINTGHGNYNSEQEAILLAEHFDGAPIDGVIQVWYINDAEPSPAHRDPPWYSHLHLSIFLWSKTDLLQRRFGARETFVDYYRELYDENAPGYAAFERSIERVGAWTRERSLPWIFVVLPEFHGFEEGGPFDAIYGRVADLAREAGASVADVTPALRHEDPSSLWVAYNDVHPNARGHAIIASTILDLVSPNVFRPRRADSGESR